MGDFYEAYKPLRNWLRSLRLDDSLYVIFRYKQYLGGKDPVFHDIEVDPSFLRKDPFEKNLIMPPWQLESLIKELFTNAQDTNLTLPKSLRKWSYFADTLNQLKDLENDISKSYAKKELVLLELHRISHRQFPWQAQEYQKDYFVRYYKIFSTEGIRKFLESEFGLSTQEYYMIAFSLWGLFQDKVSLDYPPNIEIKGIDISKFNKFIEHFSLSYSKLKEELETTQVLNDKFAYSFNLLRKYPLVRMGYFGKDSLVCPDSTMLFWRFTDGLYYEISQKDSVDTSVRGKFGNLFGSSFQDYVGEVLLKVCGRIKFYNEKKFGSKSNVKDSVDWIIEDRDTMIFLECKTKRMQNESKVEIYNTQKLDEDLRWMANAIVKQVYKNISHYKHGDYSHLPYDKNKRIFPLIVTLENWFLFGDKLMGKLDQFVKDAMAKEALPLEWLTEMPYSVCSVDMLEKAIQVMELESISKVMSKKVEGEHRLWDFNPFLKNYFKEQYGQCKFLFEEDFRSILPPEYYE